MIIKGLELHFESNVSFNSTCSHLPGQPPGQVRGGGDLFEAVLSRGIPG